MTTKPHDQFAKQFLEELLSPLGEVRTNQEVTDETRFVDVLFSPSPEAQAPNLGLLGRIALLNTALLEPFRNQPSSTEIRNCFLKLFAVIANAQRKAKRERSRLPEDSLARLWIISPSANKTLLADFEFKLDLENWPSGVYFFQKGFRGALIAVDQLPVTTETLWLRILGRGETQRQAVNELLALPESNPLRQNALRLITNWRIVLIQQQDTLTEDERELIMNLSQAYQQWEDTTKQQARLEGQRQVVENLLRFRFGEVDEELSKVVDSLLQLSAEEFTPMCLELSREELLARFSH
ncbi:conserved hypothetical protein (plasmid) [Trichormus variabilis ATCC 29413]|uniref:Flagellar assembly protein H n=2 Tax=Anabaena variabilis TaxID=264691 RepID=Q3M1Z8_TRIV2|nr:MULTISPECIES: hypothetical protein [Nostocaceae]ABA24988.1 conserved hypothetical protein [Trichormus variabilis ATCC 29413]MBC1217788.1 hypothetical protein [Trichormus variabilis ARAD]MBC1259068.1 hypothetical protein [Trichormus variabilis V5]MBC1270727.1 hypothetical protein [Trichormus variabilis FSR]MBC1305576.1 hypothetical protein [Trichormus variabilis N2B]